MRDLFLLPFCCCMLLCGAFQSIAAAETLAVASFPKIDIHTHVFADSPAFVEMLERIDMRVVSICEGGADPELLANSSRWVAKLHAKYPARIDICSTFDATRWPRPEYSSEVIAWLDDGEASGALMVKMWKDVGMEHKAADGAYLMPDNPVFDPIYAHLANKSMPFIAHLADPQVAWQPLDPESVHYGYYAKHPEYHFHNKEGVPQYQDIIKARDRVLARYPGLTFIGAHLGSMADDLDAIAERLERYPNFHVEIAARTGDLSRHPTQKVRDFFLKYQDRILYGTDLQIYPDDDGMVSQEKQKKFAQSAERHYQMTWEFFAGTGTVSIKDKEVPCLNLPREVLEKFYRKNALRLLPRLRK
jgi:predicted TIM-barrel fold metal-dependent hydrolase